MTNVPPVTYERFEATSAMRNVLTPKEKAFIVAFACPAMAVKTPRLDDFRSFRIEAHGINVEFDSGVQFDGSGERHGGVYVSFDGGSFFLRRRYRRKTTDGVTKYRALMARGVRCRPAVGSLRATFEGDQLVKLRFKIRVCHNGLRKALSLPKRRVTLKEDSVSGLTISLP